MSGMYVWNVGNGTLECVYSYIEWPLVVRVCHSVLISGCGLCCRGGEEGGGGGGEGDQHHPLLLTLT